MTAIDIIPPMTDPMGLNWRQPRREEILIDSEHAAITEATFRCLAEYSSTLPTGVYPGKMWRRHDVLFDLKARARGCKPVWMLCWYGESDGGRCSINFRPVLIVAGKRRRKMLPESRGASL